MSRNSKKSLLENPSPWTLKKTRKSSFIRESLPRAKDRSQMLGGRRILLTAHTNVYVVVCVLHLFHTCAALACVTYESDMFTRDVRDGTIMAEWLPRACRGCLSGVWLSHYKQIVSTDFTSTPIFLRESNYSRENFNREQDRDDYSVLKNLSSGETLSENIKLQLFYGLLRKYLLCCYKNSKAVQYNVSKINTQNTIGTIDFTRRKMRGTCVLKNLKR